MNRVDKRLVLELLDEADRVIARGGWAQHGPAADSEGRPMVNVQEAHAWSPIGALMFACERRGMSWIDATTAAALRALQIAVLGEARPADQTTACSDIANANDALEPTTGRPAVARWFSTAISIVTQSMPRALRAAGGAR